MASNVETLKWLTTDSRRRLSRNLDKIWAVLIFGT